MQTSQDINFILGKLANDDAFRARLLNDPVAALADMGVVLSPEQIPAERSLPTPAAICAEQMEYLSKLESTKTMVPFLLSGTA
ncbi:NHLP-related RiPP peptide [Duganella callida]|uniref:Putative modified peptide n=1 Tax=Duganella callida TaxID=2561932 RepID=A0A4Y9SGL6_9BURK|nr:NHLP-related RiPP peptide [Duganella callida]TFW23269.1 putative modified peptide [Duganella callida]